MACNSLLFTQIQSNSLSFLACSLYADPGFCFAFKQQEKLLRVWGSWAWLRPLVGQAVLSAQQLCDRLQGLCVLGCLLLLRSFGTVGLVKKQRSTSLNLQEQHRFSLENFGWMKCSLGTPKR